MDWCLRQNELLRPKSTKPENPPYTNEKFEEIFRYIRESGILEDIGYEEHLAAGLGERLQRRMMMYCRRHRPNPY